MASGKCFWRKMKNGRKQYGCWNYKGNKKIRWVKVNPGRRY